MNKLLHINTRAKYPKNRYPFSDALCNFMDSHPEFYQSLKLANSDRFDFIRVLACIDLTKRDPKGDDEVLGFFYLDKSGIKCNFHHGRICKFKQDYVVNVGKKELEYVSYTAGVRKGTKYSKPIKDFFKKYGNRGKFFYEGNEWQHHYRNIDDLPCYPGLRESARKALQ